MDVREQNKDAVSDQQKLAGVVDLRNVTGSDGGQPQTANPHVADDMDIIEDEWVAIVKRIVEEYKDDPHAFARAMALLRADYVKKRYNKEVKVAD